MKKIELTNVYKSFNKKIVLKNVSFTAEEGEFLSLLGPSGSGKSTLLKIIAGIHQPDSGDILMDGASILKTPIEKRGTIIVFQDHLLFPHLNLEDNIGFGLKMAGIKKYARKEKVKNIINLLKLEGSEKKYPEELSGGQKQRAALGRAIAVEPGILLLDEPFSSLDTSLRDDMREIVSELHRKLGITTILVTHDKEEALMLSDKVALLLDGIIVQCDTPQRIYEYPSSIAVADFFGEKNYIEGILKAGVFHCCFGEIPVRNDSLTLDSRAKAMLRPEDVHIYKEKRPGAISGTISKVTYAGDRTYYTVSTDNIKIKCTTAGNSMLNLNSDVSVVLDFSKAIYYRL